MATEWDGQELIELCKQRLNRGISPYWDSLMGHDELAQFFAYQAKEAWDEYARNSSKAGAINNSAHSCEAYVVACIQFLNPMADMLSQIITKAVFEGSHAERWVRANEISDRLKKRNAFGIKNAWDTFYKSDEFSYVNAFCNTIKHRRLVRTEALQFDITGTHGGGGNVFMPFEYNGRKYPELTVSTIVFQYREQIRGLVLDTGVSITDYLKSL